MTVERSSASELHAVLAPGEPSFLKPIVTDWPDLTTVHRGALLFSIFGHFFNVFSSASREFCHGCAVGMTMIDVDGLCY